MRSLEVTLASNTATHRVSVVESGELVQGWLLAANATEVGQAQLALAGATPVSGVGGLATTRGGNMVPLGEIINLRGQSDNVSRVEIGRS